MEKELTFIMGALLCAFMCALALHSLFLCCLRGRRPRRTAIVLLPVSGDSKGLDSKNLAALPTWQYKDGTSGGEETEECVICLGHFAKNDILRVLPECSHRFHVGCIDRWLVENSSCPTCRGSLLTVLPLSISSATSATATGLCEGDAGSAEDHVATQAESALFIVAPPSSFSTPTSAVNASLSETF